MDSAEFIEWLAFETLENPENFEKIKKETILEDSLKATPEQISDNVFTIFNQLGLANASRQ